jgi:hypothetical protein
MSNLLAKTSWENIYDMLAYLSSIMSVNQSQQFFGMSCLIRRLAKVITTKWLRIASAVWQFRTGRSLSGNRSRLLNVGGAITGGAPARVAIERCEEFGEQPVEEC